MTTISRNGIPGAITSALRIVLSALQGPLAQQNHLAGPLLTRSGNDRLGHKAPLGAKVELAADHLRVRGRADGGMPGYGVRQGQGRIGFTRPGPDT